VQDDQVGAAVHAGVYAVKADAAELQEGPADEVAVVAIVLWPG